MVKTQKRLSHFWLFLLVFAGFALSVAGISTAADSNPSIQAQLDALQCSPDKHSTLTEVQTRLESFNPDDPAWSAEERGHFHYCMATVFDMQGDLDKAYQTYSQAIDILEKLEDRSIWLAHSYQERSYVSYLKTNHPESFCPDREQSLKVSRQLENPELIMGALIRFAYCFVEKPEQLIEGLSLLDEAMELASSKSVSNNEIGMIFNATALLYRSHQLYQHSYDQTLKAYQAWALEEDYQDMFNMLHGLIGASVRLADWDKALIHLKQMQALTDSQGGNNDFAFFLNFNTAKIAFAQQHYAQAVEYYQKALELEDTTNEQFFVRKARFQLSLALFRLGLFQRSAEWARQLLSGPSQFKPERSALVARSIAEFGQGEKDLAIQTLWQFIDQEKSERLAFMKRNSLSQTLLHNQKIEVFQSQLLETELKHQQLLLESEQAEKDHAHKISMLVGLLALALFLLVTYLFFSRRLFIKRSQTDYLTGIANRRHGMELAEYYLKKSQSGKCALSLVLLDIDFFKMFNDEFGHDIGDEAIRHLTQILSYAKPAKAQLSRMGGEEFMILLPGLDAIQAQAAAEHLRSTVQSQALSHPQLSEPVAMTISLGLACVETQSETLDQLYRQADQALYLAKSSGRNCVKTWQQVQDNYADVETD